MGCLFLFGAGDRTRTGTLSPAVDFESTTSTIPSHRQVFSDLKYNIVPCKLQGKVFLTAGGGLKMTLTYGGGIITINKIAMVWAFGVVLREKGAEFRENCSEKINRNLSVPAGSAAFSLCGKPLFQKKLCGFKRETLCKNHRNPELFRKEAAGSGSAGSAGAFKTAGSSQHLSESWRA